MQDRSTDPTAPDYARADLRTRAHARSLGWGINYSARDRARLEKAPEGIPHDDVTFDRHQANGAYVKVWKTRLGWRSALLVALVDGYPVPSTHYAGQYTHGWADDALDRALAFEYPAEALAWYQALQARKEEAKIGYDGTDWLGAAKELGSPARQVGMGYHWCMIACDELMRDHRRYLALADTDLARYEAIPAACLPAPLNLPFLPAEPDMFGRTN